AGTSISLRNSRDTAASSIVGAATINQTVLPGEVFSFKIQVHNKSLGDSVFFYLDNFNSPAYTSVVFATTPAQLNITLNVVTASYVEVYTNKRFSSVDTVEFSAGIEENTGSLSDTALSGVVNVFSDNGLPANIEGQLYFLDESRTRVLDSFFIGGLTIGGGQTDVAGNS